MGCSISVAGIIYDLFILKKGTSQTIHKNLNKDNVYKCKNYLENNFHLKEVVFSNS